MDESVIPKPEHENCEQDDEVIPCGIAVEKVESCEYGSSESASTGKQPYEHSDGDEDGHASHVELEEPVLVRMTSQTSAESYEYEEESSASEESDIDDNSEAGQTATGSAGGGTSKASDKGKSEQARPRARCDVDELNAYMSSPDALAAFHGSKYNDALVGAAASQESRSEDCELPPASIAASGAAVPPPPPPLPAPAEDENAAEAAEVAARAEMIRAAVAARSKHGGVRMELWCRRILWIAIDPARFLLDWERAVAWGLDPNLDLVARLEFDSLYLDAHNAPKITQVRQAPPGCDLNRFELDETQPCGLEWVIQDRLNSYFREAGGWPHMILSRTVIDEVAECAVASVELAIEALRRSSGDKNDALELLLDPTKREHLDIYLATEAEAAPTLPPRYHDPRGIFARNSMIREAVISLRSLFPNAPGEALLATVEIFSDASKGKCDLASAATALGDNPEIQSSLRSSNLESPWDAASVWRAKESTMAQANFIMRIVHFIEDKVRSVNSRCMICDSPLSIPGFKPSVCDAPLCSFRHEEFGLGLELAAEVLRNPSLLDLLVSFLYTAVHGGRVGLMYPSAVQRSQADGTVRSFVKSDLENNDGSSPSDRNGAATSSSATNTAAASPLSPESNVGFPAERMNLPLLKDVLDKMPSIACLQAWARGEEAPIEVASDSACAEEAPIKTASYSQELQDSAQPLDAETTDDSCSGGAALKSMPDDSRQGKAESAGTEHPARERSGTMLRRKLDELDDLLHPLLRWLRRTNKAHLRPLRADERFSGLDTPFQFVLLSGPVEREQHFQALKQAHGSLFSWHGSSSGNWHVILRTSLKNMSNTKYMSAGAAYGNGIYFSDKLQVSLQYCGMGRPNGIGGNGDPIKTHWPKSAFGDKLTCLALCEIVDKKDDFTTYPGKGACNSNGQSGRVYDEGIYVVPREDLVTTRFFIVNPKAAHGSAQDLVRDAIGTGKLGFLKN